VQGDLLPLRVYPAIKRGLTPRVTSRWVVSSLLAYQEQEQQHLSRVPTSKASMRIHALPLLLLPSFLPSFLPFSCVIPLPLHMVRSTLHLPVIAHCLQGTVLHLTTPWRLLRNHQHPATQRHHSHKQWTSMSSKGLCAHRHRASTTSDCSHPQQYMTSRLANAHMLTVGGWVSHSQLLCSMSWT
jgi:hypothetical protein